MTTAIEEETTITEEGTELEVMVGENEYGFVDAGNTSEEKYERKKGDGMGVPLIPAGPEKRTARPLDFVVCALVVAFMVGSAQLSKALQVDYKFHNPAFIIWFSTSWLVACFPIQIIYYTQYLRRKGSIVEILGGMEVLRKNIKIAPLFTIYWYLANYLFVWGIVYTNVASSLAIEQAATVFVFILSVIFLKESATIGKVFSVLICIGGVIVVAFSDKKNMYEGGKDPLKGDFLIIGSCCATAAYMVTYKKVVGSTDVASVNTLLGFIGLCDILFLWPIFTTLHFIDAEPLTPKSTTAWGLLVLNAFLSFNFNYLLNLGIFLTSPLFFRVAQICSVPASFALDVILHHSFVWLRLVGAGLIVGGFSLFSYFTHVR